MPRISYYLKLTCRCGETIEIEDTTENDLAEHIASELESVRWVENECDRCSYASGLDRNLTNQER